MKKSNVIMLAITMFAVGFGVNNVAMSNLPTGKIAVVDVNSVVSKSAQVQALKKEQESKVVELDKWLKTVSADIEKQKTQEGKEKLAKKYQAELSKKRDAIAKNYNKKLNEIDKSITKTIADEAKDKGYDVVLTKSSVLYGGEDITTKIAKLVK